jgi:ribosomal protein L7Ae-like RNA K-turn-binding protein
MSLKELKEANENGKVKLGIKQVLKAFKDKKKKSSKVFVVKDARNETIEILQSKDINFEFLKNKEEVAKELELDFESEVFLVE